MTSSIDCWVVFVAITFVISLVKGLDDTLGCFANTPESAMKNMVDWTTHDSAVNMTIEKCKRLCKQSNVGLSRGSECYCGDTPASNQLLPDGACDKPCRGNSSQVCGGQSAVLSIYTVCPAGYYGNECQQRCHCSRERPCSRTGVCNNSRCETGWYNPRCSFNSPQGDEEPLPIWLIPIIAVICGTGVIVIAVVIVCHVRGQQRTRGEINSILRRVSESRKRRRGDSNGYGVPSRLRQKCDGENNSHIYCDVVSDD